MQVQQIQKMKSPFKYPNQVTCKKREEINLYADVVFKPPSDQELIEGAYPGMDAFGKSRFDFYIFKYESSKSVKYSMGFSTIKFIYEKTKALMAEGVQPKKNDETQVSPAYTVQLKGGTFSGRTAAEILINNPEEAQALCNQRDYYMKNSNHPKYGKNNLNMANAVNDAINLYNQGLLDPQKVTSAVLTVYEAVRTPNKSKVDERGLTKARSILITHDLKNNDYIVKIMNCMAPPADGNVGAKLNQAADSTTFQFSCTEEEWWDFISECYELVNEYREVMRKRRFTIYETNRDYNY